MGQLHLHTMPAYLPLPALTPLSVEAISEEESMPQRAGPQSLGFLPRNEFAYPSSPQQCCQELLWPAACTLILQVKGM